MLKILSVVGTRPNFVKIAPLLAEMRRWPGVCPVLVHTGQHFDREMSDCFLDELRIPAPDFVLRRCASAGVADMVSALREVIRSESPDVVLVVGDVNSTLAGAEAAAGLGIPVAHVEAGLRSFDPGMVEERNRIATDQLSELLFASEPSGVVNLLAEGRPRDSIFLAGNVMIDTLKEFLAAARRSTALTRLGLADERGTPRPYALATLHRPATVDNPEALRRIWGALEEIADDLPVIFPAHPRTQTRLGDCGLANRDSGTAGVRLIGPLPYLDFVRLESAAALVMTDSGGVQEETTAMCVPCLTLRNNTERPITVREGTNQVVGLDPAAIVAAARRVLSGNVKTGRIPRLWDGRSAQRIVSTLCRHYGTRRERAGQELRIPVQAVPAAVAC
ncbi:MAG TPA: UDP-N-acetylglucosamine 2-epimerase (non-hydrolyzing) [Terriglobia bacterium]|nr:UDP-N-acetylglucosamine 2-epimerase (non-hydrolyzing) [Terriglobia bacterium]